MSEALDSALARMREKAGTAKRDVNGSRDAEIANAAKNSGGMSLEGIREKLIDWVAGKKQPTENMSQYFPKLRE